MSHSSSGASRFSSPSLRVGEDCYLEFERESLGQGLALSGPPVRRTSGCLYRSLPPSGDHNPVALKGSPVHQKFSPRLEPSSRDAAALDSSVMGPDTRPLRQPVEADSCIAEGHTAEEDD